MSVPRVPLLELVDAGTRETDLSPGIDAAGLPVLRQGETVLFETRSFPTVAVVDDDTGNLADTFLPGDGGVTTITDRRIIFVRDSYDAGTFADGLTPWSDEPSPSVEPSDPNGTHTVAAGHVWYRSVTAMSYQHRRRLFWVTDTFYFSTRIPASGLLVAVRVRQARSDLCQRVVESLSVARGVDIPVPAGRPDGSMRWEFGSGRRQAPTREGERS